MEMAGHGWRRVLKRPDGGPIAYEQWLYVIGHLPSICCVSSTRARTKPGLTPVVTFDYRWGNNDVIAVAGDASAQEHIEPLAAALGAVIVAVGGTESVRRQNRRRRSGRTASPDEA